MLKKIYQYTYTRQNSNIGNQQQCINKIEKYKYLVMWRSHPHNGMEFKIFNTRKEAINFKDNQLKTWKFENDLPQYFNENKIKDIDYTTGIIILKYYDACI